MASTEAPASRWAVATPAGEARAPGGACPWMRVDPDGVVLVRSYTDGPLPAVAPQPVQDVVYVPGTVMGPAGPVAVPMPQVVTLWREFPPSAAPAEQPLLRCGGAGAAVEVAGAVGEPVAVPPGYEARLRPGEPPSAPAPIGTQAAEEAARAASAQALQAAGLTAQQAGAAIGAQTAWGLALAGAQAAFAALLHTPPLGALLQTVPPPTPTPAAGGGGVIATRSAPCAPLVGGHCTIAGRGFFGQCTKIGSMSCTVTVVLAGAGLSGVAPAVPQVEIATSRGTETLPCSVVPPGTALKCVGTLAGDAAQAAPVTVRYAPRTTLAGIIAPAGAQDLREPVARASVNGLLDTTLAVRYGPVAVAGITALSETYEGSVPDPTLRFRPGDRVRVRLDNQLPPTAFDAPAARARPHHAPLQAGTPNNTNLHLHGLHVSPQGNSDNIFLTVPLGQAFQYEYQLPADQPAGLYWYHAHFHGLTEQQTGFGMAGAIIVEGGLDTLPGIAGLRDRLLLLHAIQFAGNTVVPGNQQDPDAVLRTVNGQLNPVIRIQPGETQRWRVANVATDNFFRIHLDGHSLYQIASDGNPWREPVAQDAILLGPGERAEVLVQCRAPGTYVFRTLPFTQPFINTPDAPLATVVCEGPAWVAQPLPTTLPLTGNNGQPRIVRFEELPGPGFNPRDRRQGVRSEPRGHPGEAGPGGGVDRDEPAAVPRPADGGPPLPHPHQPIPGDGDHRRRRDDAGGREGLRRYDPATHERLGDDAHGVPRLRGEVRDPLPHPGPRGRGHDGRGRGRALTRAPQPTLSRRRPRRGYRARAATRRRPAAAPPRRLDAPGRPRYRPARSRPASSTSSGGPGRPLPLLITTWRTATARRNGCRGCAPPWGRSCP